MYRDEDEANLSSVLLIPYSGIDVSARRQVGTALDVNSAMDILLPIQDIFGHKVDHILSAVPGGCVLDRHDGLSQAWSQQ